MSTICVGWVHRWLISPPPAWNSFSQWGQGGAGNMLLDRLMAQDLRAFRFAMAEILFHLKITTRINTAASGRAISGSVLLWITADRAILQRLRGCLFIPLSVHKLLACPAASPIKHSLGGIIIYLSHNVTSLLKLDLAEHATLGLLALARTSKLVLCVTIWSLEAPYAIQLEVVLLPDMPPVNCGGLVSIDESGKSDCCSNLQLSCNLNTSTVIHIGTESS